MSNVVIVGAGPAGFACAYELVHAGLKIILIEKKQHPGGKACAGGLTTGTHQLGGIESTFSNCDGISFGTLDVRTKLGRFTINLKDTPLTIIDRKKWANAQLDLLKSMGVEIHLGERFDKFDDCKIITKKRRVKYDYLVAADGSTSKIRKQLGLGRDRHVKAFQIRIPANKELSDRLSICRPTVFFDSTLFGSGYAWIFPACNELRMGCGVIDSEMNAKKLRSAFLEWIGTLGLDDCDARIEAGNICCDYKGHRFGRVFLTGDAAGLASPLTGEGIGQALMSGKEIAREIIDPSYRSKIISKLATKHRRTTQFLSKKQICGPLYCLAPFLLQVPFIRKETIRRYMS